MNNLLKKIGHFGIYGLDNPIKILYNIALVSMVGLVMLNLIRICA